MKVVMRYNVNDRNADSDWFKSDQSDFVRKECQSGSPNNWKREDGTSLWENLTSSPGQCYLSQDGGGRADLNLRNNDVIDKLVGGTSKADLLNLGSELSE